MNKKEMRKLAKKSYKDLTSEYKKSSDLAICKNILKIPECRNADTVFCFVGTEDEINTIPLIIELLMSGKSVCVPLCIEGGVMEARKITSVDELSKRTFDIPEPSPESENVPIDNIDFAVVPCLTCNKKGHRLGKGGGYYDRFFENLKIPAAVVCREEVMFTAIPTEERDIIFDTVISERGVYRISQKDVT